MIGPILAAIQGVQAVASLFSGSQKPAGTENLTQAADSSSTKQGQSVLALPTEIQNVLNTSVKALASYSTRDLMAELGKRPEAAKTIAPSTPVPQAGPASAGPAVAASNTDTENATGTNTPSATAESNPTNARTSMQNGKAVFENDNYIIAAGDNDKVTIYNKKTEEVYEAVGDPSMKIDGKAGFSGKGTMSLMLNDGTKVTMGRADDGKGGTLASKLTITNGAYGAQIKGIDTTKTGDLAVQEFSGQGKELDEQVADGVTMEENQNININNGRGFVVKDANGAATLVSKDYLAKVSNGDMKAGNLDQFDLPGGDQTAEVPSQAVSTANAQSQDPEQRNQAASSANSAGTGAIQDQFAKNQAARKLIDCFGSARQTNPATASRRGAGSPGQNQNQNGNTNVRTAQAVVTNGRRSLPGNTPQRVQTNTLPRGQEGTAMQRVKTNTLPRSQDRNFYGAAGRSTPIPSSERKVPITVPAPKSPVVPASSPTANSSKSSRTVVDFTREVRMNVPSNSDAALKKLNIQSLDTSPIAIKPPSYNSTGFTLKGSQAG